MKYPKQLVDSTVKTFLNLRVPDQSSLRFKSTTENTTWVVTPLKEAANILNTQLKDRSVKIQTIFLVSNQCLRAARLSRSPDKRSKASAH